MDTNLSEVTNVLTTTSDITETTLTIGYSENVVNSLNDISIHLGNIEVLMKLILQFMIIIVVFKGVYFIVDKVFFSGV